MSNQKQIGRFIVTATDWQKHGKHRIYFSLDQGGQACYDVQKKVFIKTRNRVGARFEYAIKEAFDL